MLVAGFECGGYKNGMIALRRDSVLTELSCPLALEGFGVFVVEQDTTDEDLDAIFEATKESTAS